MKRVLIITYYWPPSGGSGVQRWLKFTKYLPQYNWQPIVYTPSNPSFEITDPTLLKDVNPKVEVLKRKIWEPYKYVKLFSRTKELNTGLTSGKGSFFSRLIKSIRGNIFIPDPRKFWVNPSVKYLEKYITKNGVDVIITTGPPHSMHLIGLKLKQRLNIPWVMDIRDPWSKLDTLDNFNLSNNSRKKYEKLESTCLQSADAVIGTSYSMPELMLPFDTSKYDTITNGYDTDDFKGYNDTSNKDQFVLYYAGLINAIRNPIHLWEAIEALLSTNADFKSKFKLHLVGKIEGSVIQSIKSHKLLADATVIEPYKDHDQIIADYGKANALLLLINNSDNAKVNIPGKLFEYLATGKPVVSFGALDSDANVILAKGDQHIIKNYTSSDTLKVELEKMFLQPSINQEINKTHSRNALTSKLSLILQKLHDEKDSGHSTRS